MTALKYFFRQFQSVQLRWAFYLALMITFLPFFSKALNVLAPATIALNQFKFNCVSRGEESTDCQEASLIRSGFKNTLSKLSRLYDKAIQSGAIGGA